MLTYWWNVLRYNPQIMLTWLELICLPILTACVVIVARRKAK